MLDYDEDSGTIFKFVLSYWLDENIVQSKYPIWKTDFKQQYGIIYLQL